MFKGGDYKGLVTVISPDTRYSPELQAWHLGVLECRGECNVAWGAGEGRRKGEDQQQESDKLKEEESGNTDTEDVVVMAGSSKDYEK